MNRTQEFLEIYGDEMFDLLFDVAYNYVKNDRVSIIDLEYTNRINSYGIADIFMENDVDHYYPIEVHFTSNDFDGSQIVDFGTDVSIPKKTATIRRFVLDVSRINEKDLTLMENKYAAMKDVIQKKESEYNYDIHFEPSNRIDNHYRDWLYDHYLTIELEVIDVD